MKLPSPLIAFIVSSIAIGAVEPVREGNLSADEASAKAADARPDSACLIVETGVLHCSAERRLSQCSDEFAFELDGVISSGTQHGGI